TDTNGNGVLDSGEAGVAGRTVFLNTDGSGTADGTNPQTATDSNGNYYFLGLAAGSDQVMESVPAGTTLTTASSQAVTITAGQLTSGINFGEGTPASTTTPTGGTATISGTVFDDLNLNGQFDGSETGIAGRKVFLNVDGTGVPDANNPSTTTDANGNFSFPGLAAGTYQVDEVLTPTGSAVMTSQPVRLTLTAGQNVSGVMLGNALGSSVVPIILARTDPPAASDANTAYIDALYQSVLGHAPDAAGLAYWQQQLTSGASQLSVAQGVWQSTEHRGMQVDQFYEEFLGRPSDPQGKAFWTAAFSTWGTEQIDVAGFLSSQEFQNLNPGNTAMVDAMYDGIAERPADSAGESYWVNQLNSGTSLVDVLFNFIYGQEASTAVVDSFYADFLHRTPDSASLQAYVNDLMNKTLTADQVAEQILSSSEYFNDVTGNPAPSIYSTASTSFTQGVAGSFTVRTGGIPVGTITESGALPSGVSFIDNGDGTATLLGTPATGSGGVYNLTLSADNGGGTPATQSFVLTVDGAPSITPISDTSFTVGTAGSISVQTAGYPKAAISATGLPSDVTLTDNGNGTATIAGTPAAADVGSYNVKLTAANGSGTAATQSFTLTVAGATAAPAFISATNAGFATGAGGTFTVSASGTPTATITDTDASLPSGVSLGASSGGSATLTVASTTPAGVYTLNFSATNGVGSAVSQQFTLTVGTTPAFTSANSANFANSAGGTFSITTSGSPAATITDTDASLPSGVTLGTSASGSATLSVATSTAPGIYTLNLSASNGVGSPVSQQFTLTIGTAPTFTSADSTSFANSAGGTFPITTSGDPNAAISGINTPPSGVAVSDNGNGSATLTVASSTAPGIYTLDLSATNGVGGAVTQQFTLTIGTAPAFTSTNSANFATGAGGTFTITTSGDPNATITDTDASLPTGVTLGTSSNGSATLTVDPSTAAGVYTLNLSANNHVGAAVTQQFTLTIA
ncbi:MAG TPA: DUF4214 domain-containing protein, partial [Pirellulales bacterium]|nr:DUF4214 domain-containing protein [Pirellulales bacterium]